MPENFRWCASTGCNKSGCARHIGMTVFVAFVCLLWSRGRGGVVFACCC